MMRKAFGAQLAERILALSLPQGASVDMLVWVATGRAKVRSTDLHTVMGGESSRRFDGGWIWRMWVHSDQVAWDCLPTKSLLVRRRVRISPMCLNCLDLVEFVSHALLECPRATQIWRRASFSLQGSTMSPGDLLRYVRYAMRSSSTAGWGIAGTYLAYHFWLDRNNRIIKDRRAPLRTVVERSLRQAGKVTKATEADSSKMARDIWDSLSAIVVPMYVLVSWKPPPPGHLKVNFDGSLFAGGDNAGVACVIRDCDSMWVGGGADILSRH
ncbi:uncharacterized protein LOC103709529 [Phoenix dactylifera]|uniref:Uncharacterized protein LOC103709529 n=1 Tax=Phoenix dactylifera TaxID=42345 RepID=A0A8B7C733_PHODC|nr:uncharacterized protein LOC103709529 [Phoenix dactylifera]